MPKSAVLGNGSTLICFDRNGLVKDVYFHYPGLENHVGAVLCTRWVFLWERDCIGLTRVVGT